MENAALVPDPSRLAATETAWRQLLAPGPVLTVRERRTVMAAARAAWSGQALGTTAVSDGATATLLAEAAHWLAVDAGGINEDVVADLERRGLDRWHYLEVVGIVARLANIDFYARGLGASIPEIPIADRGNDHDQLPPTDHRDPDASRAYGFVPVIGKPSAPFVLDALPHEGEQLRALHQPMYLPFAEIMNADYTDAGITKAAIEFVAARVSYLNECFY